MSPKPPKKKAKAEVNWGKRPTKRPPPPPAAASADSFVQGAKDATIRLNLDIPRTLHARIKSQCAMQSRNMREVVMELLESRFPPSPGA